MNAMAHPGVGELTDYVLGKLPMEETVPLEAHLTRCMDCQLQVENLEVSSDSFVSGLRSAGKATDDPSDQQELERLLARTAHIPKSTLEFVEAKPQEMIAGHIFIRELKSGGFGAVFLAFNPGLKRKHAIKRPLSRNALDQEKLRLRFYREREALGAMDDKHIIRAVDAGQDHEGPYLVMDYIDGESLSELVRRVGRLGVTEACELTQQIAIGLQTAHLCGFVHRDIKPSNLMLKRAGSEAHVVIIDWGLVKRATDHVLEDAFAADQLTLMQTGMGTPDFIAPEQIVDAGAVDIRADIYSLGVTLYCLLTGHPPFHDRSKNGKIHGHLSGEKFPLLDKLPPDVTKGLQLVLEKMVKKDPEDRYQTPAEVASALQPFCCGPKSSLLVALLESSPPGGAVAPAGRRNGLTDSTVLGGVPVVHPPVDGNPAPVKPKESPRPAPPASPQRRRRSMGRLAVALAMPLLLIIFLFGDPVYRFVMNQGVLVIRNDDPNIVVTVKHDHALIADKSTKRDYVLTPGEGEIEVYEKKSGLKLRTKRFTITRGRKETVVIDSEEDGGEGISEGNHVVVNESQLEIGSSVIVTANVKGFEDDSTDHQRFIVNVGTKGKVVARPKYNRYKVRLEIPGKPEEVWIESSHLRPE